MEHGGKLAAAAVMIWVREEHKPVVVEVMILVNSQPAMEQTMAAMTTATVQERENLQVVVVENFGTRKKTCGKEEVEENAL